MGEEIVICVAFLPILPNLHNLLVPVGYASAWQTRGRGLEPLMLRCIFSLKYPGAQRTSC